MFFKIKVNVFHSFTLNINLSSFGSERFILGLVIFSLVDYLLSQLIFLHFPFGLDSTGVSIAARESLFKRNHPLERENLNNLKGPCKIMATILSSQQTFGSL